LVDIGSDDYCIKIGWLWNVDKEFEHDHAEYQDLNEVGKVD
jgi:hypothetical protein